jgi:hypothetical protein
MRRRTGSILFLALLMLPISCGRKELPRITNPTGLQQDCSTLCAEFPADKTPTNAPDFDYQHRLGIRKIPSDKWPATVAALRPYMVCCYQDGIQIWIDMGNRGAEAYYVPAASTSSLPIFTAANRFVFEKTEWEGIFTVNQKF